MAKNPGHKEEILAILKQVKQKEFDLKDDVDMEIYEIANALESTLF